MPNAGIMASSVALLAAPCTDVLMEPFDNLTAWSNSGGTIVSGRTGTGAQMGSFAQAIYTIPSPSRDSTITIGCSVKISAGSNMLFGSWWPGGGAFQFRIGVDLTAGTLIAYNAAGGSVGVSAGGLLSAGNWYYVEAKCFMHDTTGTIVVRLNGIQVINATGIDTRAGSPTTHESIQIGPPNSSGGGQVQYDDLYISAGAACPFKGWQRIGSCNAVLTEPFNNFTDAPWTLAGTTSIVAGRTGTAAKMTSFSGTATYTIPSAKESDTITVSFAVKVAGIGSEAIMMKFRSDSGATVHGELRWNSAGSFIYLRGSSGIGTSAAGVIQANTWNFIEVQVKMHDTLGTLEVRSNGVPVIGPLTGLDTRNGGTKTTFDTISLETTWYDVNYDDMYISSGTTCAFPGDPQSCILQLEDPFTTLETYWASVGTPLITTGRTGTGVEFEGSTTDSIFYAIPAAGQSNTLTVGFAFRVQEIATRVICQYQSEGVVHLELATNASGGFDVRRGTPTGTILASSSTGIYTINTWYYLEFKASLHNSAGFATLVVDGTQRINISGLDTRNGPSKMEFDRFAIGTTDTQVMKIDDFYLSSGAACAFKNGINTVLLEPFNNFTDGPWTGGDSSWTIQAGGRTGTAARGVGALNTIHYAIPSANQSPYATIGFAYKVTNLAGTKAIARFEHNSGATVDTYLQLLSTGALEVKAGGAAGTLLCTSAASLIAINTWYYIEMSSRLSDTVGTVTLRLNGTVVASGTGLDTMSNPSMTNFDSVALMSPASGINNFFDDLYLSTGPNAVFKGSITL